jgi:hypothetical protein
MRLSLNIPDANGAAGFWLKVREVPSRAEGRKSYHEEQFSLGLYLLALEGNGLLTYPFTVEQDDEHKSPDFIITEASGAKVGLEITSANSELLQEAMTWADRANALRVTRVSVKREPDPVLLGLSEEDLTSFVKQARSSLRRRNRETPIEDVVDQPLIGAGWVGDQPEREWVAYVQAAVLRKVEKLESFRPATRHDLLVNDDTPVPAVNRRKVVQALSPWIRNLQRANPLLGRVNVIASLDVLFDIGGSSRIFPYVFWSGELDSERVEDAGRILAARVIHSHQEAGNPVYFVDEKKRLIKRTSEGRLFQVRVLPDGQEITEQELTPG